MQSAKRNPPPPRNTKQTKKKYRVTIMFKVVGQHYISMVADVCQLVMLLQNNDTLRLLVPP